MNLTLKEIEAIIERNTGLNPARGEAYFKTYEAVIACLSAEAAKAHAANQPPSDRATLPMPGILTIRLGEALGRALSSWDDGSARAVYADYCKWRDEHPTSVPARGTTEESHVAAQWPNCGGPSE